MPHMQLSTAVPRCLLVLLLLLNGFANASASMPGMSNGNDAEPARSGEVAASMQDGPCHSHEDADAGVSPPGNAVVADDFNASDDANPHACCSEGDCSGHGCRCDCLMFGAALPSIPPSMPLRLAMPVESILMPSAHPAPPRRKNQRPPIG